MKKAVSFVLVLALGLPSVSLAAEDTWIKKTDMPTARYEFSTSVVKGLFLLNIYSPAESVE